MSPSITPTNYLIKQFKRINRQLPLTELTMKPQIFVTPEYNAGIPGGLKNALNYIYNEWLNKPAPIISYGVRPLTPSQLTPV